jgi:hypothetical protein
MSAINPLFVEKGPFLKSFGRAQISNQYQAIVTNQKNITVYDKWKTTTARSERDTIGNPIETLAIDEFD